MADPGDIEVDILRKFLTAGRLVHVQKSDLSRNFQSVEEIVNS